MLRDIVDIIFISNKRKTDPFLESDKNLEKVAKEFSQKSKEYEKIVVTDMQQKRKKVLEAIEDYKKKCRNFIKLNTKHKVDPINKELHQKLYNKIITANKHQQKLIKDHIEKFYNSCELVNEQPIKEFKKDLATLLNLSDKDSELLTKEVEKVIDKVEKTEYSSYQPQLQIDQNSQEDKEIKTTLEKEMDEQIDNKVKKDEISINTKSQEQENQDDQKDIEENLLKSLQEAFTKLDFIKDEDFCDHTDCKEK